MVENNKKKVILHVKIDVKIVDEVPADWDGETVDFYWGESSNCKSNILEMIDLYLDSVNPNMECLCPYAEITYVKDYEGEKDVNAEGAQ